MLPAKRWRPHVLALVGFVVAALAFSWPLPINLDTHLTGIPAGDTGVYVWNQWVFRHELIDHGRLPFQTDSLFSAGNPANLSLHNYTTFQNLLALPLIPLLGVVATFNIVYLLMTVLTGYSGFLLARRVTGAPLESWLAGLLFAWSPSMVARGTEHFSLVAAAPLALFLLLLLRTVEAYRLRDAVGLGVVMWWAASTDVYYAVYCVLLAAAVLAAQLVSVQRRDVVAATGARWLNAAIAALALLIAGVAVSGGGEISLAGLSIRMRSLYTPVLVLTVLVLVRLSLRYRLSAVPVSMAAVGRLARHASVGVVVASVLLLPVLYAAAQRLLAGEFDTPQIFWRSSPPGIDPLALVVPNPHHPLVPGGLATWIRERRLDSIENVAALPWVVLLTIAGAAWAGWRAPRRWVWLTAAFGLLAMGPFLVVAGMNTHVPGPWALLRYVPVVGLARTPARFNMVLVLMMAVLFALALVWLRRRYPAYRYQLLAVGAVVLPLELLPAPRPLYTAAIPEIYTQVAAAPAGATLLEIPFGIRDGTFSVGNFTARTQYFQTAHGKSTVGGYLSRIASRRVTDVREDPVLDALAILSENQLLPAEKERALIEHGPAWLARENVQFVVVDRLRASVALRELTIRALQLELVSVDGELELYRPAQPSGPSGPPRANR
jgi:hypothetical protein